MANHERAGLRLTVPADVAHVAFVRACLRDAVTFRSLDDESSFLVALTEVVVNAIEAARRDDSGDDALRTVVVELFDAPGACVVVTDDVGDLVRGVPKRDHLGAGLAIAEAFVADLHVDSDERGTRVRLGLDGASA